ncbi:type VII secretion target [Nocardia alba]|uniref:Excreted virulence factor EspC (Type VII ESX diderm) n=1 Tax=Nocardia alba TaxID=225051 RepID=A0A4R1FN87_9NOCA|nr:type VII secretion target [Nocardia alba]TCJ96486.1 excreted virulence factor EspC (type VII ESX diderm) [Nocardia alba]
MQVSPSELRSAATEMDRLADDNIGRLPVMDTSAGSLGTLSTFLSGADVAPQLDRIEPARTRSLQIVGGRYREFGSPLRTSAESYTDTDVAAAARIAAVSDLNSGEMPQ